MSQNSALRGAHRTVARLSLSLSPPRWIASFLFSSSRPSYTLQHRAQHIHPLFLLILPTSRPRAPYQLRINCLVCAPQGLLLESSPSMIPAPLPHPPPVQRSLTSLTRRILSLISMSPSLPHARTTSAARVTRVTRVTRVPRVKIFIRVGRPLASRS